MVKNLINIKNIAIVVVFSLIAFIGFNSFISKPADSTGKVVDITEWYTISVSGTPSNPASQTIIGVTGTPPSGTSPTLCAQGNEGEYCSVAITYDPNEYDPEDFETLTVAQADALTGVTTATDYAFQPEP